MNKEEIIKEFLSNAGKKGGSVKSERKAKASAENGKLGGRPKMIVNQETMKQVVNLLKGKNINHENIESACKELGFRKVPKINIGRLVQTPDGLWTTIYYNNMTERFSVDENDMVL